jgi:hypothetical protein
MRFANSRLSIRRTLTMSRIDHNELYCAHNWFLQKELDLCAIVNNGFSNG